VSVVEGARRWLRVRKREFSFEKEGVHAGTRSRYCALQVPLAPSLSLAVSLSLCKRGQGNSVS
jgi:hypothetical protein